MFLKFIQKAKNSLSSNKKKWFVMGNEAADLDSVVSSLVYSYYKQEILGHDVIVIPVCCIPFSQITLKKDVVLWLKRFNLDAMNDLVFLDDINDLLKDNIQITLVDHHKPQVILNASDIREVIDHRIVAYCYPDGQLLLNNIECVGSCSTLIAIYIIAMPEFKDKTILLSMLRGVILIDTDCLAANNGKTTDKDVCTMEAIDNYLGLTIESRREIYTFLNDAKSDITDFSLTMMVKRDLKTLEFCWNNSILKIAIPTLISIDIEDLLAINELDLQLKEIMRDLCVNIFIGLTCGTSVHNRRGYLMFSDDSELITRIYEYLLMPEQGLDIHPFNIGDNIKCFYQNDTLTSRKIFIPIIDRFFNNEKKLRDQYNNCNLMISQSYYKTCDSDIIIEIDEVTENEGAPYTLNTPLRSYSSSPDNRSSDMSLPSLNNRYTSQLVDKKRQKHHAEMDVEVNFDDTSLEMEIINIDDKSPSVFTPENSDDESIDGDGDSNEDNIGPLPLLKKTLSDDKLEHRRTQLSEQKKVFFMSKADPTIIDDVNNTTKILADKSNRMKSFNCGSENIRDSEFNSLIDKVDKKRKKLNFTRIDEIANTIVNDVMNKSKDIVLEEKDFESIINDWSECYSDDEKKQILKCINSNDFTKLAELLTSSLIRDCLNVSDIILPKNELVDTDIVIDNELCTAGISQTDDNDDNNDNDSLGSLETIMSQLENNYDNCHLGNLINKENQSIHSSSVNSSSADVVENISFNLYRRISSNQLDYSNDEKELLITAGDWLPKEEVIYSDTEQDEYSGSNNSRTEDGLINEISEKDKLSTEDIYISKSMNT